MFDFIRKTGIQAVWIREHIQGKTFADVGGLWGTKGEKITIAHLAGAKSVSMIDAMPPASDWWDKFFLRAHSKGLEKSLINCVTADLEKLDFTKKAKIHDFVHCAGVLYHVPNPLNVLRNLANITEEYLSLSTQIIPERIENEKGSIVTPPGQSIFIPSLTDDQKHILAAYYDQQKYKVTHINREGPPYYENGSFNYGPSFWLPTIEMVIAMIEIFDFKVTKTAYLSDHGAAFFATKN